MASNLELEGDTAGPSSESRIFIIDETISPELLARTMPTVANVNINQSSEVHFGPKFVSITQIVDNRVLRNANRLPVDRNISKKRKPCFWFCCAVVVLAVLLTIALIVHLIIIAKTSESLRIEEVPWRVTREMWLARHASVPGIPDAFSPTKLVIIQHTVSPECWDFESCASEMRDLQAYFLNSQWLGYDLPYQFVIGNDGRVYESRRWNTEGAHTMGYNRCSIGIGFVGDYRETNVTNSHVTDLQMSRLRMLLQEGVDQGYLMTNYSVVGARDLGNTISPGENLYRAIQTLEHYDKTNFRGLTCEEIYSI